MIHENSQECSIPFDYAALDGLPTERLVYSQADVMERLRWMISFIRNQDKTRLTVDCLYLALGDAEVENTTMTTVAGHHGLTKAAVSKRVREVRQLLHLPINANNKSASAVEKYKDNRSPIRLDKPA